MQYLQPEAGHGVQKARLDEANRVTGTITSEAMRESQRLMWEEVMLGAVAGAGRGR
jgi:hypothetical protein